jgi:pilus assembly protein CpaC
MADYNDLVPTRGGTFVARGIACAIVMIALGWTAIGSAQMPQERPPVGPPSGPQGQPGIPVIPQRFPRPAEGPEANQRWDALRDGIERAPVASFVDTLRGNDAAVEVPVGQGRLLTLKHDVAAQARPAFIAVGDPTMLDFEILPNPRMIRLTGKRPGITDLSVTAADGQTFSFEVRVVYDLEMLRARLRQAFPDTFLRVAQMREHLVIEGEARTTAQVSDILKTAEAYMASAQASRQTGGATWSGDAGVPTPPQPRGTSNLQFRGGTPTAGPVLPQAGGASVKPQIINLIRVPGVHQVLLQVRVAELNRTALRQIGADIFGVDPKSGTLFGTNIAGSTATAASVLGLGGLTGSVNAGNGASTTAFGIFPSANFAIMLRALRDNSLLSILAEPNLIALDGHRASFLAGGQFPVPVPQGGGGVVNNVTIEFKNFGVQLDFTPHVLDDDTVRLAVTSEVSSIDFTLGTTLVVGGSPVPGLNTRVATTTVELREGQTLAIAGLLQVEIDAETARIPGLGDLPIIGPLFSNTSHKRIEKELVLMVTPHLVAPMNQGQVPPTPGCDLLDPNDLEFYLLNRIEGRGRHEDRAALERRRVSGPVGFSQ